MSHDFITKIGCKDIEYKLETDALVRLWILVRRMYILIVDFQSVDKVDTLGECNAVMFKW